MRLMCMTDALPRVEIYTDGACSGNPGPGGYGVILRFNGKEKELTGGAPETTNNRMELTAAIEGLAALKRPCAVTLYSDSKYLIDSVQKKWVYNWRQKGWVRGKNEPVPNTDLWKKLLELLERHQVTFCWVKGHAGHPENQRCDQMAVAQTEQFRR